MQQPETGDQLAAAGVLDQHMLTDGVQRIGVQGEAVLRSGAIAPEA